MNDTTESREETAGDDSQQSMHGANTQENNLKSPRRTIRDRLSKPDNYPADEDRRWRDRYND
jgi:hypothetical protein